MKDHKNMQPLSYQKLGLILAILFILTFATVGISTINLGIMNIWLALFIAVTKSTIVLLFFMHMKYESNMIKYTFIITIGFIGMLIGFIFWDIAFR